MQLWFIAHFIRAIFPLARETPCFIYRRSPTQPNPPGFGNKYFPFKPRSVLLRSFLPHPPADLAGYVPAAYTPEGTEFDNADSHTILAGEAVSPPAVNLTVSVHRSSLAIFKPRPTQYTYRLRAEFLSEMCRSQL